VNLTLSRVAYDGFPGFRIQGECAIKNLPDADSECGSYAIDVTGTVDLPTNAAIRKITLTLKCSGA
jgi:hypothetical protein